MTKSMTMVAGIIGACLLTLNIGNRIGRADVFPSPEQDMEVMADVQAEMEAEFGDAWSAYRSSVCKTNEALYARMAVTFREKLDTHYGYDKQAWISD